MNRRELLLLTFILSLAAALRMGWPGVTEFKRDEAHLYGLALDVAELKRLPLAGISSSVGLPNSPVSVYLFALPLFVWKSPLAATLFVGLLNTASVGLAYVMARRYWGARAALAAALLYAAAPWAVIYSRKIWAQNLLPLFTVGYVFAGLLAFVEARGRWLWAHLALLAVTAQIHLSGLALIPLTGLLLVIYRKRVAWREVLLAGGPAALVVAGAGAFVLARSEAARAQLAALLARPAEITGDAVWLAALVAQGWDTHSLAGPQAFRAFLETVPDFDILLSLGGLLALAGAVLAVGRWRARGPGAEAGLVVVLWLAAPIVFFLRHSTPVFPHYFILLFPAPYLLAGLSLDALMGRLPAGWPRASVWLVPLAIAGAQVWLFLGLLRFIGTQATPGAFGPPLAKLMAVAEAARGLGADEIIVAGPGSDPAVEEVPAVFEALLRGARYRLVDARTTAVFPAGSAAVILWPDAGGLPLAGAELYRRWVDGPWAEEIDLRAGEGRVRLALGEGEQPAVPRPRAASALLSNGAEVLGSGGGESRWELWWRAPGPAEGENYHVFAHLIGADGARAAQADQPTLRGSDWRAGDLVVNIFELGGAGAVVRAGMYAFPSLSPAVVLDAEGNPAGEWVELPPD